MKWAKAGNLTDDHCNDPQKGVTSLETGIHNTSEIGRLRRVMLHRPGGELENLMPEYLERLLFDDIP